MKKFIVFCMLCIFLFTASLFKSEYSFSDCNNLSVQVFANNVPNDILNSYSHVKNGEGEILFCDYNQYKTIKSKCKNISGVTFVFDGDYKTYLRVLKNLNINYLEQGKTDFVGYTNVFSSAVLYNNKKVNIQGYFNGKSIFIGTPLLLGSY